MGCIPGMVEVLGGNYLYGESSETEYLPTFYIDQYEVTAGDYKSCVDAGMCAYNGGTGSYHTYDNDKDDHPINNVNWNEATAHCAWKGKRLPTEQEWKKAARGTDGRTYPWAEDAPDGTRSNYYSSGDEYEDKTTPVGYYNGVNTLANGTSTVNSPSFYGAYDMAGNAWEWTNSCLDSDNMSSRGGSFSVNANWLPAFVRSYGNPGGDYVYSGVRCAQ
jgi:formylglycine-generating enzyme required for sulfatase activity